MKAISTMSILLITITLFLGCTHDEPTPDPAPPGSLELEFTLETNQDQMGDFANNAMVEYDGNLYSVGGINSYSEPDLNNQVWKSANGVAWTSLVSGMFPAREGPTLTDFNGNIWLIGGLNDTGDALGDIWYSPDGEMWTNVYTSAPFGSGLGYHATFIFGTKMWLYAKEWGVWSTVNGFDWVSENITPFPQRVGAKIVVLNDIAYCIGGYKIGSGYTNEIWKSIDGANWNLLPVTGEIFSPRVLHTATVYNNKIWVIGGDGGDTLGDIWYSSNAIEWHQYEGVIPFTELSEHTVLNYRGKMWLFGGRNDAGLLGKIYSINER